MLPNIQRSAAQELTSALFSVSTINRILADETKSEADIASLKNNVTHLQNVVARPIWTNEDLTPLNNAIEQGLAWLALELPPVEDIATPPEMPSEYPWGNRQPTLEELDAYLIDLRNTKDKEINAQRLAANNSFFMFKGKKIACDPLSRSDIDGTNGSILLRNALPPGWPGGWKTMDDSYVQVATLADWTEFYSAMYMQGLYNFSKAQTLKQQIAQAATIEAIRAIVW